MSLQAPQRPQLKQAPLKAPSADDKRSRRNWLLVALLLLLLVPLCLCIAGQAALSTVGMNEVDKNVLSHLSANYSAWEPESFNPLHPELIGTIRAEQATFAANSPLLGTIVPLLPLPGGQTQIALISATPTVNTPTASPTVPTSTPSPTRSVVFIPLTNTPIVLGPTPTFSILPTDTPTVPSPGLADISISKSDSADPVAASSQFTYALRVRNAGARPRRACYRTGFPSAGCDIRLRKRWIKLVV